MTAPPDGWYDVVGRGRMGGAIAGALREAGVSVRGPHGRGATGEAAAVVLLCVPDREIAAAARAVAPGPIVGHVSASAELDLLAPHERFSMHPLMTIADGAGRFGGAAAAIEGSSPRATAIAESIATTLGMRPLAVAPSLRPLYHAAASAASNFLVVVEGMAESLATSAGIDRAALAPLVRTTVENWARLGARDALTGPIARGDEATVARQRAAVASAAPDHLPLWDALTAATRLLASRPEEHPL